MFEYKQPKRMRPETAKRFMYIAGVVSAAAVISHILSFSPVPFISMGQVWPIHVAIFIPFGGMIWAIGGRHPKVERQPGDGLFGWHKRYNERSRKFLRDIISSCPPKIWLFSFALVVYVAINFIVFIGESSQGSPKEKDGQFYLSNHGRIVREIDVDEYKKREAYTVRGFSGHWMIFSFLPFVYFRYLHNIEVENDGEGPQTEIGSEVS